MSATKPVVRLDDIYDEMRACYAQSIHSGRNWHAVTVGTDGTPYCREEVSPCYSESEYFGQGEPYRLTVWHTLGCSSVEADEVVSAVEDFDPAEQFNGYGGVEELVRKLETAGFAVEF